MCTESSNWPLRSRPLSRSVRAQTLKNLAAGSDKPALTRRVRSGRRKGTTCSQPSYEAYLWGQSYNRPATQCDVIADREGDLGSTSLFQLHIHHHDLESR